MIQSILIGFGLFFVIFVIVILAVQPKRISMNMKRDKNKDRPSDADSQ